MCQAQEHHVNMNQSLQIWAFSEGPGVPEGEAEISHLLSLLFPLAESIIEVGKALW